MWNCTLLLIYMQKVFLPNTINTALMLGVDIQDILRQFGISIDLDHITQSIIDLKKDFKKVIMGWTCCLLCARNPDLF